MIPERPCPATLWLVRHGQSAGNVAREAAETGGGVLIDIAHRDVDVPLSELGERQARAAGRWFGQLPEAEQPEVVISSPYVRAAESARLLMEAAGLDPSRVPLVLDERLREKEFGILDRLTRLGVQRRHPDLAEASARVGKFYFRPPGGESWCDVLLRLRNFHDTLCREYCRARVLVVAHQVVVLCVRYLLEGMTEKQILEIDRAQPVPNCSVTSYEWMPDREGRGALVPRLVGFVAPLEETHTPITREPDVPIAPR